jgi:hypothetical protein
MGISWSIRRFSLGGNKNKYTMTHFRSIDALRLPNVGRSLLLLVATSFSFLPTVQAQDVSPLAMLESFGLDTMRVGRVTAYFAPADRARAEELAVLTEEAAAFFEQKLGFKFDLGMAALAPELWFSDIPGIPYAIPWPSMPYKLIFMPASLSEG